MFGDINFSRGLILFSLFLACICFAEAKGQIAFTGQILDQYNAPVAGATINLGIKSSADAKEYLVKRISWSH